MGLLVDWKKIFEFEICLERFFRFVSRVICNSHVPVYFCSYMNLSTVIIRDAYVTKCFLYQFFTIHFEFFPPTDIVWFFRVYKR